MNKLSLEKTKYKELKVDFRSKLFNFKRLVVLLQIVRELLIDSYEFLTKYNRLLKELNTSNNKFKKLCT